MGEHPPGFDTCAYDAGDLADLFGVRVQPVALADTFTLQAAASPDDGAMRLSRAPRRWRPMWPNSTRLPCAALPASITPLRTLADDSQLSGVAVRCWPEFFTELGCAACGAMSVLNEENARQAARLTSTARSRRCCSGAERRTGLHHRPGLHRGGERHGRALAFAGWRRPAWPTRTARSRHDSQQPQAAAALRVPARPMRVTIAPAIALRWTMARPATSSSSAAAMVRAPKSFTRHLRRHPLRPAGGGGLRHHHAPGWNTTSASPTATTRRNCAVLHGWRAGCAGVDGAIASQRSAILR